MFNIDVKGLEMELTDGILGAVNEKLGGLDKYLEHAGTPQELKVFVGLTSQHHNKGNIFKAEADLSIPGHKIHAETTGEDLYAAIDRLKDELKQRLLKTTKMAIDQHRKGAREAKEEGTETELL